MSFPRHAFRERKMITFLQKIWYNYVNTKTPWVSAEYVANRAEGPIVVKGYNKAFIQSLRKDYGYIADSKTDEELIDIFAKRENSYQEEPRLDVHHAGINSDGSVRVELDWNTSFIRHLEEHGIVGETEDEAIQMYLSLVTKNFVENAESEDIREQLESEIAAELDIAASQIKEAMSRTERRKRTSHK